MFSLNGLGLVVNMLLMMSVNTLSTAVLTSKKAFFSSNFLKILKVDDFKTYHTALK